MSDFSFQFSPEKSYIFQPPYFIDLGLGDFSHAQGIDCDVSKMSLNVLYSIVVITTFISMAIILRHLVHVAYVKQKCIHITSDPRTFFPWIFVAQLWVQQSFAIIKLICQQNQLVGRDCLITLVLSVATFMSFVGLVCYFSVILKFLKSFSTMLTRDRKDKLAKYFARLRTLILIILPTSFASSSILLIGLRYPQFENIIAITFLSGMGFLCLFYGCLTTFALKYVCAELSNHVDIFPNSSDDIKLVLTRLTEAYMVIMVMSFLIGISYFLFCTNYLMRKSTYLFIWLLFSWPPVATILTLSITRISQRVTPTVSISKSIVQSISTIEASTMSGHHSSL